MALARPQVLNKKNTYLTNKVVYPMGVLAQPSWEAHGAA